MFLTSSVSFGSNFLAFLDENILITMGIHGIRAPFATSSTVLFLLLLAGTTVVTSAAFVTDKQGGPMDSHQKSALQSAPSKNMAANGGSKKSGLLSSCLPSSSLVQRREPSLLSKQWRRFTVFRVSLQVFVTYKLAGRRATRLKKRLELDIDDPDSDDHPDIQALWSEVHTRAAQQLLQKIQSLEGFWVKVGQYLSSRADVMPPEYLQILGELQDSMPPRPWEDTWQTIQEELGEDALRRFDSIDPEPLSTASLAQVHRAKLRRQEGADSSSPHDVILKVQHRGVASLMRQDMENLRVILNLLAKTDPDLDFGPVIREYNQEVTKELDFRTEAQNMKDVSELLQASKIRVIMPETIPEMITERVLVMDFCEGFPVRDTDKLDENNVDRELLMSRICEAWAVQMHVGGIFNGGKYFSLLVKTCVSFTQLCCLIFHCCACA